MYVRFKYPIRLLPLLTYPATQPINNIPANKPYKGRSYTLSTKWLEFCRSINSEQGFRYLVKPKSGWVNAWNDAGIPIAESLSMGGNIAGVIGKQEQSLLLQTLSPDDEPPTTMDKLLIHKFTCWNYPLGQMRLPANGIDVFFPFIINGPAWVHQSQVDVFDALPPVNWPGSSMPAMYAAVVIPGAVVRQAPSGNANKIEKIYVARMVQVYQELNGWAMIGEKRWVEMGYIRK